MLSSTSYVNNETNQLKGLSPNGLLKVSCPFLDPDLGGGLGGPVVTIIREIDLSRATMVTSGLEYCFLDIISSLSDSIPKI